MRRPLLAVAVALSLGTLCGTSLARAEAWRVLALAASALLIAPAPARPRFSAALLGAVALAVGAAAAALEARGYEAGALRVWAAARSGDRLPVLLVGRAAADGVERDGRRLLLVDVEALMTGGRLVPLAGRARLEVGGEAALPEVLEGERLSAWASLAVPRGLKNPGDADTEAWGRREGIEALAYCKTARLVTLRGRGPISSPNDLAARLRAFARERLFRFVTPGPEQGLVRAMVLGDRSGLDLETAEDFRAAGTYHVLAISGGQVTMVAGGLLLLLRGLRTPPLATALGVTSVLGLYALLVGGDPPVARAALTLSVLLLGRALELDADPPNLLGLAAVLLLLHRPASIGDVGFQLSFAATLGILLFTGPLLRDRERWPLQLDLALAASLAAQAALLPLLALHFHRLAPAALVLNLLAVPLSGAVLLVGAAVPVSALVAPALGQIAADVAWALAHALLLSGQAIRLAPALDVHVPTPPAWALALHVIGLGLLLGPRPWRGVAALGASVLGLVAGPGPVADGRLHLTVLDVGQGDALVLRSPSGRAFVIDAGGGRPGGLDRGESVVAPFLWDQGLRSIDRLALTHAHADHVAGAPSLLRLFAPAELWEGPAPAHDLAWETLELRLRQQSTSRRTVFRGVGLDWDGVRIDVLGPQRPRQRPAAVRNDDSLVLCISFGEVRILLTGDIEAAGEQALGRVRAEVLKVPHHGSRSSSSAGFLEAMRPGLAVVSVGRENRFGHPHAEALDRLRRNVARLLRTDLDGAVTVSTDGHRIWLDTATLGEPNRTR